MKMDRCLKVGALVLARTDGRTTRLDYSGSKKFSITILRFGQLANIGY